jgi:hypothetical protein
MEKIYSLKSRADACLVLVSCASGKSGYKYTLTLFSSCALFMQYNTLDVCLPEVESHAARIMRAAFIGFSAATSAALASNWARVIKTAKQTHHDAHASYAEVRTT